MSANICKNPDLVILSPDDDQWLTDEINRKVITALWNLVYTPKANPLLTKKGALLKFTKFRRGIKSRRHGSGFTIAFARITP